MIKLLWKLFHKQLKEFYLSEQNTPVTLKELSYAFSTSKKYYRFPSNMAMPTSRYGKLQEYLMYMSARLTAENIDLLINKGIEIIEKGIENDNGASKVAAILYQLGDRNDKIIPHQLIYNYLAVLYVREDEDPKIFNNEIHMQKVDDLMANSDNSFFFRLPELRKLFDLTTMSESEWQTYVSGSESQQRILKEVLKIYS